MTLSEATKQIEAAGFKVLEFRSVAGGFWRMVCIGRNRHPLRGRSTGVVREDISVYRNTEEECLKGAVELAEGLAALIAEAKEGGD